LDFPKIGIQVYQVTNTMMANTTITHQWLQLIHTISIKEFGGVFLCVTKMVTSASWTDQFYFTQMKAVSLGLHIF